MKSDLNKLNTIFENMVEGGFDVKNYLNWGFYFFDTDKLSLLKLCDELKSQGYTFENLELMDASEWRLHISCVDVLTPESLHNKNLNFNELAIQYHVSLYDGWDVENVTNKS